MSHRYRYATTDLYCVRLSTQSGAAPTQASSEGLGGSMPGYAKGVVAVIPLVSLLPPILHVVCCFSRVVGIWSSPEPLN